jgi:8-oxo-dGTP diphosphatase
MPAEPEVRAAGAVVWRTGRKGAEVLLIHRPRYDDWSLPKGKCERGESYEDCAVREVEEEVGLRGDLGAPLPDASYVDHKGRTKRVRYWAMEAASFPDFVVNDEVDEVRWVRPADAARLLTYAHDRVVVDGFVATT